jgi:hypothetical protein
MMGLALRLVYLSTLKIAIINVRLAYIHVKNVHQPPFVCLVKPVFTYLEILVLLIVCIHCTQTLLKKLANSAKPLVPHV